MIINEYAVMSECIRNGVNAGYTRAFKYEDTPSAESIKMAIYDAIMIEISEFFKFNQDEFVM